jgi:hypothetical protein
VEGGIRECGDIDYPGIFVRLEDLEIFGFISQVVGKQILSVPSSKVINVLFHFNLFCGNYKYVIFC